VAFGTAQHSLAQHSLAQHSLGESTAQLSTAQLSTAQSLHTLLSPSPPQKPKVQDEAKFRAGLYIGYRVPMSSDVKS
jgi:hypothetical protein